MGFTIDHCGIVILAAGKSSRLGSPKQLLSYKGRSLVQHAADAAISSGIGKVIVVTGARADLVGNELENYQVDLLYNENWEEGMASSISCGVKYFEEMKPEVDGILFMVCDQPYVSSEILKELILKQKETGMPISACKYDGVIGTPALYHKSIFPELKTLQGDTGARKIINQHADSVTTISFLSGKTDIDTADDYKNLLKTTN